MWQREPYTPNQTRPFPVFLPPSLYEVAKRAGYDMSGYVPQQLIPTQKADL